LGLAWIVFKLGHPNLRNARISQRGSLQPRGLQAPFLLRSPPEQAPLDAALISSSSPLPWRSSWRQLHGLTLELEGSLGREPSKDAHPLEPMAGAEGIPIQ
jgi:hypothetical protein